MADFDAKAKGKAAFEANNFLTAVNHFSDAIALSPTPNHLLFSNRSAAYSMRSQYSRALRDAELTVSLKPDWAKAYYRLGVAHAGLYNFDQAASAYEKGLQLDPNNAGLESGLFAASKAQKWSGGATAGPFRGPEMWTKLEADWRTRSLLQQPDFVTKLEEVQRDAKKLNLSDPRFAAAIGVLVSADLRRACIGDEEDKEEWMKEHREEEDDECEVKGTILSNPVMAQVSADFEEKVEVAEEQQ